MNGDAQPEGPRTAEPRPDEARPDDPRPDEARPDDPRTDDPRTDDPQLDDPRPDDGPPSPDLLVHKLGGSLLDPPQPPSRRAWRARVQARVLPALRRHHAVLLVPGGGAGADAVRRRQSRLGLSDRAAHHMAILAMQANAWVLLDLLPQALPVRGHADVAALRRRGGAGVWLPVDLLAGETALAQDWSVTSDSLALWLAQQLDGAHGACRLELHKSCAVPDGRAADADWLQAHGILDAAFGRTLAQGGDHAPAWRVVGEPGAVPINESTTDDE